MPGIHRCIRAAEAEFVEGDFARPAAAKLMKAGGVSPLQPGDGLHSRFQGSVADSPGASAQEGRKTDRTIAKKAAGKKTS